MKQNAKVSLLLFSDALIMITGCVSTSNVSGAENPVMSEEKAFMQKDIDEMGIPLQYYGTTYGDSFVTMQKDPEKDFVILNLTDTQMTDDDWAAGAVMRQILIRTIEELVARVKPDLITLTGDLAYADHLRSYEKTASYFDTLNIPWTVAWGNHDNQNGEERVREIVTFLKRHPYFVYCDGKPEFGNGNYVIKISEGEKPVSAIFMVDTHDRELNPVPGSAEKLCYSRLRRNQIEWLKEVSGVLKAEGYRNGAMLLHIPIFAYRYAFDAAYDGKAKPSELSYAESLSPENWKEGYKDSIGVCHENISSYVIEDGVFDALLESDFIKLVLCGHDHVNNFFINYKGIKLAYSLKTGAGSYWEPSLNGGTVITIGNKGIRDIHHEFVNVDDLAALIKKR